MSRTTIYEIGQIWEHKNTKQRRQIYDIIDNSGTTFEVKSHSWFNLRWGLPGKGPRFALIWCEQWNAWAKNATLVSTVNVLGEEIER